jgi:hypothetical protein
MTINISFEHLKKVGSVALIALNLFSAGAAVSYVLWRRAATPVFARMEWDLNDRMPQIKQRFLAWQAAEAAKEKAAQQAVSEPATTATTATPTTTTTTTTLAKVSTQFHK